MDYKDIKTELSENILTITLNRPERLNAFTLRMKDEVVHALAEVALLLTISISHSSHHRLT